MSRFVYRFSALSFALLLAACGGGSTSGTSNVAVTPGNFYRYADEGAVFEVPPTGNTYCLVVSVSQMEAFGGFAKVHLVDHSVDIKGNRDWTEQCPWPAGKYRNVGSRVVYAVGVSHNVCREPPRLAKQSDSSVKVVASDSNVLLKSHFTGTCAGG